MGISLLVYIICDFEKLHAVDTSRSPREISDGYVRVYDVYFVRYAALLQYDDNSPAWI